MTTFDRLLQTLDVEIQAIALCELSEGIRLIGSPEGATIVHYVLHGSMYLSVDGGEPLYCPEGGIVVVPPGISQAISVNLEADRVWLAADHVTLGPDGLILVKGADGGEADLRFACESIAAQLHPICDLVGSAGAPFVEDLSDLPFIRQAFAMMLDETSRQDFGGRAMASALMKACLILLVRRRLERIPELNAASLHHPKIGRAVAAVLENPSTPHTVETLAVVAGMSRSGFAKEFMSHLGVTPMVFVGRVRLAAAATLLKSTSMPIKALAGAVGFSSRSHFSRCFREAYGADPTQYRLNAGGPSDRSPE